MTGNLGSRRMLVRGLIVAGVAMSLTLGGTVAVSAGGHRHAGQLSVTYNEDLFLAKNSIRVTQTFDHPTEFPPEQRTVYFQGVRFRSKDTAAPYWRVGGVEGADVQCPEVCRLYRAFSDGPDETADMKITFRRRGSVRSFGFLLDVFGAQNQFVIRVVESDGKVTPIWLPPDTGDIYVGLHSRIGIRKIVIQQPNQADGFGNFAIDEFSRSYITTRCHHRTR